MTKRGAALRCASGWFEGMDNDCSLWRSRRVRALRQKRMFAVQGNDRLSPFIGLWMSLCIATVIMGVLGK